jgi:ABC-type Na+ transport system ATPase subunit NatA
MADAEKTDPAAAPLPTEQLVAQIDPGAELLADLPISSTEEDLLARLPVAQRIVELACAAPVTAPRVVALTGGPGAGKSSVLRMVTDLLADRGDAATVSIDGAGYPSAQALANVVMNELTRFFGAAGVVDASDKVRDTLASYGGMVAGIARSSGRRRRCAPS